MNLLQKILAPIKRMFVLSSGFMVALIIICIRPIVTLRLKNLRSDRIGHFAHDVEMYLCMEDMRHDKRKKVDVFYCEKEVCNEQLKKMWERQIFILPHHRFVFAVFEMITRALRLLPKGDEHIIAVSAARWSKIPLCPLAETKPHLSFTTEDETVAQGLLTSLGIEGNTQFVCVYGRDSEYLRRQFPHMDWSHHDVRDMDIQTVLPTAEWLVAQGYYVIRMGSLVKEPLNTTTPGIVDYATSGLHSDFLDIFLSAKCDFFLGVPGGIVAVPTIFRKPLGLINWINIQNVFNWDVYGTIITKKIWHISTRRFFTYRETLQLNAANPRKALGGLLNDLAQAKEIEIVDNTPEEILLLAQEVEGRIAGNWQTTAEDEEMQRRFRSIFDANEGVRTHSHVRLGTEFLRQNSFLLN